LYSPVYYYKRKTKKLAFISQFLCFLVELTGAGTKNEIQNVPYERSTPTFSHIKDDYWY